LQAREMPDGFVEGILRELGNNGRLAEFHIQMEESQPAEIESDKELTIK
jgi:hypothetical protein